MCRGALPLLAAADGVGASTRPPWSLGTACPSRSRPDRRYDHGDHAGSRSPALQPRTSLALDLVGLAVDRVRWTERLGAASSEQRSSMVARALLVRRPHPADSTPGESPRASQRGRGHLPRRAAEWSDHRGRRPRGGGQSSRTTGPTAPATGCRAMTGPVRRRRSPSRSTLPLAGAWSRTGPSPPGAGGSSAGRFRRTRWWSGPGTSRSASTARSWMAETRSRSKSGRTPRTRSSPTPARSGERPRWWRFSSASLDRSRTRSWPIWNPAITLRRDGERERHFLRRRGVGRLRLPEGVVRHETAHQWFGDAVTERDWHDLWLSEGFATYFDLVVGAALHGDSVLDAGMRANADLYFRSPVVTRPIVDTAQHDLLRLLNASNLRKRRLGPGHASDGGRRQRPSGPASARCCRTFRDATGIVYGLPGRHGDGLEPAPELVLRPMAPPTRVSTMLACRWRVAGDRAGVVGPVPRDATACVGPLSTTGRGPRSFASRTGERARRSVAFEARDAAGTFELPFAPAVMVVDPDHLPPVAPGRCWPGP